MAARKPPTERQRRLGAELRAEERRARRDGLALALEGVDVGPWVMPGHRIGTPATAAATGVAS